MSELTRRQVEEERQYAQNLLDTHAEHPKVYISPTKLADARKLLSLCDMALRSLQQDRAREVLREIEGICVRGPRMGQAEWADRVGCILTLVRSVLSSPEVETREEIIEACAKVCEDVFDEVKGTHQDYYAGCMDCAAQIRALKERPQ